jgi:hypothetical protein
MVRRMPAGHYVIVAVEAFPKVWGFLLERADRY